MRAEKEAVDRTDRIERILEELRLNTEDMHELARQATAQALADRASTRVMRANVRRARRRLRRPKP